MKTFTKSLSGLLSASVLAIGLAVIAQPAAADVTNSVHNLGTTASTDPSMFQNLTTAEICVFCHTPHQANTAVAAPLWNKNLPGSTYTVYTSATMDTALTSADITGVSLACLSCHDGTQTVDNMVNEPGSGLDTVSFIPDAASNMNAVGPDVPNLGTNLSNDHPIGMNYCSATSPDNALIETCGDADFNPFVEGTTTGRLFVSSVGNTTFDKTTDLPLYGIAGDNAEVVCATCHDPHNTVNGTFLRLSNAGSALCLTCHAK